MYLCWPPRVCQTTGLSNSEHEWHQLVVCSMTSSIFHYLDIPEIHENSCISTSYIIMTLCNLILIIILPLTSIYPRLCPVQILIVRKDVREIPVHNWDSKINDNSVCFAQCKLKYVVLFCFSLHDADKIEACVNNTSCTMLAIITDSRGLDLEILLITSDVPPYMWRDRMITLHVNVSGYTGFLMQSIQ